jgi:hypothetical protein
VLDGKVTRGHFAFVEISKVFFKPPYVRDYLLFRKGVKIQCCRSRTLILIPDFFPSRIPYRYPESNNKKEEGGIIFCLTFFVAINFTELKNYLISEKVKKKI